MLRIEAQAVLDAADRLDARSFDRAIDLLVVGQGRVIVTGAGTSGIVARKIAATFTSTGTPALFLHPGDALHGALGMVDAGDVAILISNSGETDELLTIQPYLTNRDVLSIAITGNMSSTLAKNAAVALDASAAREACPLNLAPTATTTVALAIGDALAMTVMEVKGLSPEAFARNHPSGRLGRRLLLKVKDLMRAGDANPVVTPTSAWLDVVEELSRAALGGVNVVDTDGRLLGLITDGDLRRAVQRAGSVGLQTLTADALMTREPVTVGPEALAYEALQMMESRQSQISVLPVVDTDGRSIGLLRLHDLIRSGL